MHTNLFAGGSTNLHGPIVDVTADGSGSDVQRGHKFVCHDAFVSATFFLKTIDVLQRRCGPKQSATQTAVFVFALFGFYVSQLSVAYRSLLQREKRKRVWICVFNYIACIINWLASVRLKHSLTSLGRSVLSEKCNLKKSVLLNKHVVYCK